MTDIQTKIDDLTDTISQAEKAYYVDSKPIMSDHDFDTLFNQLVELEKQYPQFKHSLSPTSRIGSDLDSKSSEKEHTIPVLSLDKCYSIEELNNWVSKNSIQFPGQIDLVVEPKIDGAGVVLYYNNGELSYALTRGNGFLGNDITDNIKTIKSVPLTIDYKGELAIRGEVYIEKEDFKNFNTNEKDSEYANPRNLASGSIRRLKSSETRGVPLKLFVYEGYIKEELFKSHIDNLMFLKQNGFRVNLNCGFFSDSNNAQLLNFENSITGKLSDYGDFIKHFAEIRNSLRYEIDGLVIKINNLAIREELGFTRHHPRWAIAFKFDAILAETVVNDITVQIGRGGRVTPVAILEPVLLSGSTISRATLHNQDYINTLGLNCGDRVAISKRGDVIPAVEKVIEKIGSIDPFKMPETCPECHSVLVYDGAHLFCENIECPKRMLGTMQFFVSRSQMDIESLGDKTLEFLFAKGMIRTIPDIYIFDYNALNGMDGFGDKKVSNIIDAVSNSKKKSFITVLSSLGLKDIGEKTAELLIKEYHNVDAIIEAAKKNDSTIFSSIFGIGEGIALSVIKHFTNKQVIEMINTLKNCGLQFQSEVVINNETQFLSGTKWVVTGSFEHFKPRDIASEKIKLFGGEIVGAVSTKTNFLLCGSDAGSKLDKAKSLGIRIIEEEEFISIITRQML